MTRLQKLRLREEKEEQAEVVMSLCEFSSFCWYENVACDCCALWQIAKFMSKPTLDQRGGHDRSICDLIKIK